MQILNYWTQFEHTGRVEDYLSYVSGQRAQQASREQYSADGHREGCGENRDGEQDGKGNRTGANPYAGIHMGNRNHTETDARG